MPYTYERTAAKGDAELPIKLVKNLRGDLNQAVSVLKTVDDYLYEGSTTGHAAKALGALTTAERLLGGLRKNLEKASK